MRTDGAEVADHSTAAAALRRVTAPIAFLRAERGLLDGPPFYTEDSVARWLGGSPVVETSTVPDTNHYSILLGAQGAAAVAHAVTRTPLGTRDHWLNRWLTATHQRSLARGAPR